MSAILNTRKIVLLCSNALKCYDERLVNHGVRVAYIAQKLLNNMPQSFKETIEFKSLFLLSLYHDIGAYKTEEIDKMVQFETADVDAHSIYGYLFLKHFTPLNELSEVLLYHHSTKEIFKTIDPIIANYAQLIHIADRIDIALLGKLTGKKLINAVKGLNYFDDIFVKALKKCVSQNSFEFTFFNKWANIIVQTLNISEKEATEYLEMMIYTLDFKSPDTMFHSLTTSTISLFISRFFNFDNDTREILYYGTLTHDIGKIAIPSDILEHNGFLDEEKMKIMRKHSLFSEEILKGVFHESVVRIAARHHEQLNGMGYPYQIQGKDLTTCERIVAVADVTSALLLKRSYKDSFDWNTTVAILNDMVDKGHLDGEIVYIVTSNKKELKEIIEKTNEPLAIKYNAVNKEYEEISKQFTQLK